jgi:phage FluMu protein Com
MKKDEDILWGCSNCGFQLGRTDRSREVIRIKHKDLYLRIGGGGWIETDCRRCGTVNKIGQIESEKGKPKKEIPFNPVIKKKDLPKINGKGGVK